MASKKIIRLSAAPEGFGLTPDDVPAEMFASDPPIQHSHEYYQDEELGLYVGVWDTTDMIEAPGPYACDEFMWLLEGEAAIRNCKTGKIEKVVAGEAFVIPKGYDCQWRQVGYLRKFFLVSENPYEPIPDRPTIEGIIIPSANAAMKSMATADPFLLVNGSPDQKHHVCYEDCTGNFMAGTWESDPFESVERPFPFNAFACVISGSLTLRDEGGGEHLFKPGAALFVPEGVMCNAQASEKVKVLYAIVKAHLPGTNKTHAAS